MHTLLLLWPRRCHCTRQPLVYGCSPHSPVLRPACGLLKCQMQLAAVLSDHVNSSFLLSSHLSCSMYIAVVCYFRVSFIFHPIHVSKVSLMCPKYRSRWLHILSVIPILILCLLNISLFLILFLLMAPSILHRHAISNTLSFYFCFFLIVHISALYSTVLNTSTSYMHIFVALLGSLEFHTFQKACQVPLANPILLSTSLSDPFYIYLRLLDKLTNRSM